MIGEKAITLQLRPEPTLNGDWVYRREGVRATVYVNQRIFVRDRVPETITITSKGADVFRLTNNLDKQATEQRIQLLENRVTRKQKIATTALHKADTLRVKAQRLTAALDRLGQ